MLHFSVRGIDIFGLGELTASKFLKSLGESNTSQRRQPPRLEATGKEETVKQYIQQITQKKLLAIFSYAQENNFCLSGQGLSHLKRKDL